MKFRGRLSTGGKSVVSIWLLAVACATQQVAPVLTVEGATKLTVDRLGPVDGPRIEFEDGTRPEGLEFTVSDTNVATIDDGRLIAKAPGETQITATWQEQEVVWTLEVDPAVDLRLFDVPATLAVGETATLSIEARIGQDVVEAADAVWASSNIAAVAVDDGTVTANEPGVTFITARIGTSEAMAEISVVER